MPNIILILTSLKQASYRNQMSIKRLGYNFGTIYAGLNDGGVSVREGSYSIGIIPQIDQIN